MYRIILAILFVFVDLTCVSQGINSKAIEITNVDSDEYTHIETTKLKMVLPAGFVRKNATTYENLLAQSYISVQQLDGDVNRNFYTFDKKSMFKAGIVVSKETFFKINGIDAMMIDGDQYIDEKEFAVSILIIGNCTLSYLIMGTTPKPIQNNMNILITNSLLSTIFNPKMEAGAISKIYSYTIDTTGTGLVECMPMGNSRTFTDDGNVPSKTGDMTSLTIREMSSAIQFTEAQKKDICLHRIKLYPLTWDENSKLEPQKYSTGKLSGYEIYASGVSKFMKTEFIYQLVLFDKDRYFVITGISYGDEKKCLDAFRKLANSIEL
ncbi:MAG: hypothetical protein J6W06_06025 [Bacteroidales bacterium]|nr:hypothetical protein [Bacteroidales bacterium]